MAQKLFFFKANIFFYHKQRIYNCYKSFYCFLGMKPKLYLGKFGREMALNQLCSNTKYCVLVTSFSDELFWRKWFESVGLCSYKFIKNVMRRMILENSESNFIVDVGNKKITRAVARMLSDSSVVISQSLQTKFFRFTVIDDEMYFGFRVPVQVELKPPSFNDSLSVSPPEYRYCVGNVYSTKQANNELPPAYENVISVHGEFQQDTDDDLYAQFRNAQLNN